MFYELAQLAVGNLLRARARLIMTAGGVLVGTSAVILLIALTIGLQRAAEAGIGNNAALTEIQVYLNYGYDGSTSGSSNPEDTPKLDIATVSQFWQIPGVAAVIPVVNLQGGQIVADDLLGYAQIMGIDPALLPYLNLTIEQGILSLNPGEVIVGRHAGDYFSNPEVDSEDGWQPIAVDLYAQPPTLQLFQNNSVTPAEREIDFNVTGRIAEGNSTYDYAILMPIQDVIAFNEWITGIRFDSKTFVYDQVTIRASSRQTAGDVAETIRDMGFGAGGMGDYLKQLNSFFVTMRLMLGGVGGVALLVAAFGVANTMTMAILERTKEIGLMKAIGATDRDVLTIFLIEAGLVGFFGGAAGISVSLFLQNVINGAIQNTPQDGGTSISFLPIDPSQLGGKLIVIPPELMIFAILLATAVGMGAGLYPALRAASLPPVIALKQE